MSAFPRTDAVVGKPRPTILALCCELERELQDVRAYAELSAAAGFKLTAALAQMAPFTFSPDEDADEYLRRTEVMDAVVRWRTAVDEAGKKRGAAKAPECVHETGKKPMQEAQERIQRDMATKGTARAQDVFTILGDPSKGVTVHNPEWPCRILGPEEDELRHQSGTKSPSSYNEWVASPEGTKAWQHAPDDVLRTAFEAGATSRTQPAPYDEVLAAYNRLKAATPCPKCEQDVYPQHGYRCVDCDRMYHRECLREHCAGELERVSGELRVSQLEVEHMRHQVGRDVPTTGLGRALAYEEMVKAFHAWLDSRPAGFAGEGGINPAGRWFDAFTAGARWWHEKLHVACNKQQENSK